MYRSVLLVQTIYYLITAVWALVHIESFMKVTGPKTDIWLVKTVAVLLLAVSLSFIASLMYRSYHISIVTLGTSCCLFLIFIDCFYVWKGTISKIYLLDALAELCLLTGWVIMILKKSG